MTTHTIDAVVAKFAPPKDRRAEARNRHGEAVNALVRAETLDRRALRDAIERAHDPYAAEAVRVYHQKLLQQDRADVAKYFDLGPADHILVWLARHGFRISRVPE